ncbi:MAG: alpha/beta hydrolase [Marinibacterium sp.]|nr:alpha/beta hydrolase [Marinibacterium sp.]
MTSNDRAASAAPAQAEAFAPLQTARTGLGYAYQPTSSDPKGVLIFAHGFMDGPGSWVPLADALGADGWGLLAADQTTLRADEASDTPIVEQVAAAILDLVEELDLRAVGQLVIVGQSMGGQIAELVARGLGADCAGLILFCPAPLAGYPLSDEMAAIFDKRARDRDPASVYQGRRRLAPEASEDAMAVLVATCLRTPVDVALQQVVAWTTGHPAGAGPSDVTAPVLLVSSDDTFFTQTYLRDEIGTRFGDLRMAHIQGAGHWPHTEKPQEAAQHVAGFLSVLGDRA